MTQRQIDRMDGHARAAYLRELAGAVDEALNVNWTPGDDSALDRLVRAETERDAEHWAEALLAPECHCRRGDARCEAAHAFPAWFVAQAQPQVMRLRRAQRQVWRAEARERGWR